MKPIILAIAILCGGCGVVIDDYAWVNERHADYYSKRGFQVVGYQGYNIWSQGRCYWYTMRRGDITYESCLMKWNGEIHEYSLKAIDAISPR